MRIKHEIYNKILFSAKPSPYESGGFLFGKTDLVNKVVFDSKNSHLGKYTPDTNLLNEYITAHRERNTDFLGIYHTHYPSNKFLSAGDIKYIEKIFESVGDYYKTLYFPIVILHEGMFIYKAQYINSNAIITSEDLTII